MNNCIKFIVSCVFIISFLGSQDIEYGVSQEVDNLGVENPQLAKVRKVCPFQDALEEKLKFKVVFQNITAGYAEMLVKSDKNPKNPGIFYFSILARTAKWVERVYSLKMSMIAYSNADDFSTLKYIEEKEESGNYYYTSQYFFPKEKTLFFSYRKNDSYENKKFTKMLKGVSVPAAFYFSRTVDLTKIGEIYYLPVAFRDKIYPIGIQVVGKERVSTSYGKQDTIVIRPIMKFPGFISGQKEMLIYLSDDEKRVPLLMVAETSFGDFKAYLIEGFTPS